MDEKISVEISCDGPVAVVSFKAVSISDSEGIKAAGDQIDAFVESNQPEGIVIDFAQVKFFSSQVLGLLLSVRSKLQSYGGKVVISAIEPQLHRVFTITNLDKIFRFYPDKEAASVALGRD